MEHVDVTNLIVVAVGMALAAAIPALLPRLPVPGVVLEIFIGAIIGPQVLDLVHPRVTMGFLASLGLGMIFLMAGLEADPVLLRGPPFRNALAGWLVSLLLGLAAAMLLFNGGLASAPMLTALALATTGIGVLMPVLRDEHLLAPPYGPMVLAGGIMGELAPLIALTLVLARSKAPLDAAVMVAFALAGILAVVLSARVREGSFAGVVERTMETSGQLPMRLAICTLILLAVLTRWLGLDVVVGAFVAGTVVRAALTEQHRKSITTRLDGLGSAFLVPIFFVTSGARLDIAGMISDPRAIAMVPVYAALMLVTRSVPALLLYRAVLSRPQRRALALHLGTQISMVVVIAGITVERGLMPGSQGAALVAAGALTTLIYPALAKRVLAKSPLAAGA
jgi:Kef-type K+ transport system membrane component KefB